MNEPGLRTGERSPPLEEGCRVAGRYRLGARVEARADHQRYEAWDEANERWVQLIVETSPTVRDARLVHHGIAQREDVGCIGEWFVSVLDAGPGEGLPRMLGRLGPATPLDIESLMIVGLGLCEALIHVGRWDLYHGDLGTRSVHVSPQLDPVILTFPSPPGGKLSPAAVPFASPERLLGHAGDARSDVYSVAALLYTLRVGHPPFGWSEHQAREGHFYDPVHPHPRIPDPVMEVLQTALEKPPRLRYPDASAFATALTEAYQNSAECWTDEEEIPAVGGEHTEEVPLEESTTVRTPPRGTAAQGMPPEDPGTTWESYARPKTLELLDDTADDLVLEADELDDRTLELGPEMLEQPTPYHRQVNLPSRPTRERSYSQARPAYIPPAPLAPAPRRVNRAEPESMELYPHGPDDLQFQETWVDTLPPARPRDTVVEEESLPLLILGAVCSLAIGMAGAASVIAFLLAQLTF